MQNLKKKTVIVCYVNTECKLVYSCMYDETECYMLSNVCFRLPELLVLIMHSTSFDGDFFFPQITIQ